MTNLLNIKLELFSSLMLQTVLQNNVCVIFLILVKNYVGRHIFIVRSLGVGEQFDWAVAV